MFQFGRLLLVSLILCEGGRATATAQLADKSPPTHAYSDAAHGVTFRIPPTWKPSAERLSVFGPSHNEEHPMLLESNDPAPTVVFFDDAASSPHTTVTGLYFIYSAKPMADATACEIFASNLSVDEDAKPYRLKFNGIHFTARYSNDADPNSRRGINGTLYSAFRSGTCFLFETTATFYDRTNGAADDDVNWAKKNHIHPAPWVDIRAHLLDIMRTVHITPSAALSSQSEAIKRAIAYTGVDTTETVHSELIDSIELPVPVTFLPIQPSHKLWRLRFYNARLAGTDTKISTGKLFNICVLLDAAGDQLIAIDAVLVPNDPCVQPVTAVSSGEDDLRKLAEGYTAMPSKVPTVTFCRATNSLGLLQYATGVHAQYVVNTITHHRAGRTMWSLTVIGLPPIQPKGGDPHYANTRSEPIVFAVDAETGEALF